MTDDEADDEADEDEVAVEEESDEPRDDEKPIIALADQVEAVMRGINPEGRYFRATKHVPGRWDANPKTIEKFSLLVVYLAEQIFGVDSDGDCQLKIRVVDRKRNEAFHYTPVPDVPMHAKFEHYKRALDVAMMNSAIAAEDLQRIMRLFDSKYRDHVSYLRMRQQAAGCDECKGKGSVRDDRPWKEREEDRSLRHANYLPQGSYRFCPKCQKPEKHYDTRIDDSEGPDDD